MAATVPSTPYGHSGHTSTFHSFASTNSFASVSSDDATNAQHTGYGMQQQMQQQLQQPLTFFAGTYFTQL
jgi:hypothetical protein